MDCYTVLLLVLVLCKIVETGMISLYVCIKLVLLLSNTVDKIQE